ncbi:DUF6893 family small protein [Jatrophihabitans sp. DSM 45814]
MRFIGRVTTIALAGTAILAVIVGIRSVPDIQRYLRMRSM